MCFLTLTATHTWTLTFGPLELLFYGPLVGLRRPTLLVKRGSLRLVLFPHLIPRISSNSSVFDFILPSLRSANIYLFRRIVGLRAIHQTWSFTLGFATLETCSWFVGARILSKYLNPELQHGPGCGRLKGIRSVVWPRTAVPRLGG